MIIQPHHKLKKYFEAWGDLEQFNTILKIVSALLAVVLIVMTIAIIRIASRPPLLIRIEEGIASTTPVQEDSSDVSSKEIEEAMRAFISLRYEWEPGNVKEQFQKAQAFLEGNLREEFLSKSAEEITYIKNTQLSQSVHVTKIAVANQKGFPKTLTIKGDRIITIRSSKFTTPFHIEVVLNKERRIQSNPYGLLITEIKEIHSKERP